MDSNILKGINFPYVLADGQVALIYEDGYTVKDGFEEPHKKIKIRTAIVVAVGGGPEHGINKHLVVGRKVLMPAVNKQDFRIDGQQYYVCHHLDIKVIDPVDDKALMLSLLENHAESLPKSVLADFLKKYSGI